MTPPAPSDPGAPPTPRTREGTTATLLSLHGQSLDLDYRRRALWSWLEPRMPRDGRVLDAGCGTGFMTRELARRGRQVTAVDAEDDLVAFTRAAIAAENLRADVQLMPLGEGRLRQLGQFECVFCLDVIEHIEDDGQALAEVRDVLSDRGTLLLSVPAMPSLYGERDNLLGHYRRYTRRALRDLCRRTSLHVEEIRYWNALGVPAYLAYERLLRRPIADGLRAAGPEQSAARTLVRNLLTRLLTAEARSRLSPPIGLSLLAVCRRVR